MRSRVLTSLVVLAGLLGALVVTAGPAAAAARYSGGVARAYQYRDGNTVVQGWVYDRTAPSSSAWMCVWSSGRCRKWVHADQRGSHGRNRAFRAVLPRAVVGTKVTLRRMPQAWIVAARRVSTPGRRIVAVARRHLGDPYAWGGASPRGFDCSGYSMYAYYHANVAILPHQSDAQRAARHMHRIRRSSARPGDLIYYLSGGSSYHVAIYAGNGAQYSAANPAQGVIHEHIWSSNIEFRTDWH
ncbi:MAG: NlpC/P60 family protein [Actinomycetota bacterium]|nr:NlpC/P60 family protein [Actinomycetota bacterium]